jgi:MFS family permease
LKSGFSTLPQNAMFVSMTFLGMTLGAFATGFLGDRFGRRFTYQANLMIFGLASLASAFAPNMLFLIVCRFFMGVGLGAENVVGYATMTEFVPPQARGRLQGIMAVFVVTGLPISALAGLLLVPMLGWRGTRANSCPNRRAGWPPTGMTARPTNCSTGSRRKSRRRKAHCHHPPRRLHRPSRARSHRCSRRRSFRACWSAAWY